MSFKLPFYAAAIALCTVATANAQSTYVPYSYTPYDVAQFDIAGVKLRMTAAEALEAVKATLGVTDDQISATEDYKENPITQKAELSFYTVQTDNIEMVISLAPQVPYDSENPVIVQGVTFEMNGAGSIVEDMKTRAIEKYGVPTTGRVEDPPHFPAEWCDWPEGKTSGSCNGLGIAWLGINRNELTMRDPGVDREMRDFLQNAPSPEPKF